MIIHPPSGEKSAESDFVYFLLNIYLPVPSLQFAFSISKFSISLLQNISINPDLRFQPSNFQFPFCRMFRLILFATLLSLVVGQCEVSVKNVGVVLMIE